MKVPQINKLHAFGAITLLLVLAGVIGADIKEENIDDPGFILGLLFIGWGLYNITAYYRRWTMVFGFGGQLKPGAHSQERGIGLFTSIVLLCIVLAWWGHRFLFV